MATTLTDKDVKIRKDRQCFSCYRKFEKGTVMHYWSGIYEGDFNSSYCCKSCNEIIKISKDDEFEEGYFTEIRDYKEQTPELYLIELLSQWENKKKELKTTN